MDGISAGMLYFQTYIHLQDSVPFGIGRFITNQQNIYRVTPAHYLHTAEKKTRERTIQFRIGENIMATTFVC